MFLPCEVLIAKHSIDNVWGSEERLLPACLRSKLYIAESSVAREVYWCKFHRNSMYRSGVISSFWAANSMLTHYSITQNIIPRVCTLIVQELHLDTDVSIHATKHSAMVCWVRIRILIPWIEMTIFYFCLHIDKTAPPPFPNTKTPHVQIKLRVKHKSTNVKTVHIPYSVLHLSLSLAVGSCPLCFAYYALSSVVSSLLVLLHPASAPQQT